MSSKDVPGSSFKGVTFLFAIRLSPYSSVTFLLVFLLVLVIPTTVVASTATSRCVSNGWLEYNFRHCFRYITADR